MSKQKVNCAKGTREADLGHAVLSASGSHRWLNCTPSARLELEFENTTSEAAREGTAAHDDNGMPLVAMHWQHRFNHMVGRYNDIYRVQMPNITLHVCRHTYCSNMAKPGMNPKTLQYLMGHSDISVTMNVYTHIGFDDAEEELKRIEEFRKARAEVEQKKEKPMSQKMFKVI